MKVFLLSIVGLAFFYMILLLFVFLATRRGSVWRKICLGLMGIGYLTTATVIIFRNSIPYETLSRLILFLNDHYLALFIFLFWLSLIYLVLAIIGLVWRKKGGDRAIVHREMKKWYGRAFIIMLPITVLLCILGHFNTMRPRTTHYTVHMPARAGVDSLRIVFASDIHIGEIIGPKQTERLQQMVSAQKPDYVLLGGDILDYYTKPAYNQCVTNAMAALHPDKDKRLYVLGNHEYYYNLKEKEAWINSVGTLLKDTVVPLAPNLYLIARDDDTNKKRATLDELMKVLPNDAVTILLGHQPTHPKDERAAGIDLALHGHTHNGQFIPFKWVTRLNFERSYGLYEKGGTTYCISSGYGVAGTTFRVGTFSEIVVLHLVFDK